MEDTKEETGTRTILVSPKNHRFLTLMKINHSFKNIDEVQDVLIRAYNKLQVMEKAEQEKRAKNGNGKKTY